jgi:hypothetical protein
MEYNFETRVAGNDNAKRRFHSQGRAKLRALAELLALHKGSYDIRSNEGGPAVSGEITLHTETVYVQISQSCLGGGMGVLIRTCKGRKDYTGGRNHWLPLSALKDVRVLAHYVRRVLVEHVWSETPAEYRSTIDGKRYVLQLESGEGTCLVPLETSRKVMGG